MFNNMYIKPYYTSRQLCEKLMKCISKYYLTATNCVGISYYVYHLSKLGNGTNIRLFVVGRGKKKEKAVHQAMMMAGMMAAAVMGPMAFKIIALMAGKALLLSKIALVLSGIIALKKLVQPQQSSHETESVSHHYGRSMQLDAHDKAYSGQKQ